MYSTLLTVGKREQHADTPLRRGNKRRPKLYARLLEQGSTV